MEIESQFVFPLPWANTRKSTLLKTHTESSEFDLRFSRIFLAKRKFELVERGRLSSDQHSFVTPNLLIFHFCAAKMQGSAEGAARIVRKNKGFVSIGSI